jgi:formimidoylglutamate deiminase
MKTCLAKRAWVDDALVDDLRFGIDAAGHLQRTTGDAAGAVDTRLPGVLVPGMPNLHSHAFQRAMAGLSEHQTQAEDSFWTWREVMYGFAARFAPDTLRDVAAMLYAEMLEAGYTSVCEFHYLHHAPDGRPYADPAAMSLALIEAARETGIGLTLLPTLYMQGGFDGRALSERQRRFGHGIDAYLRLVGDLRAQQHAGMRIGLCFHSLRAVPQDAMRAVLEASAGDPMPIHIHIAEQIGEVQDSLAVRNARPVEWLLDHMPVDPRWTLVHATHMTEAETRRVAASGATVAICTTTEANLGDGLFPLRTYIDAGGRWGVGSDSHISVSPVEELRWLEYGQRLVSRRRNIGVRGGQGSVGASLFAQALDGGAHGTQQPVGALRFAAADGVGTGSRADFLLLDDSTPELDGREGSALLDSWIFSGNRNPVQEVWVAGTRVVAAGRHRHRDALQSRYRSALQRLRQV